MSETLLVLSPLRAPLFMDWLTDRYIEDMYARNAILEVDEEGTRWWIGLPSLRNSTWEMRLERWSPQLYCHIEDRRSDGSDAPEVSSADCVRLAGGIELELQQYEANLRVKVVLLPDNDSMVRPYYDRLCSMIRSEWKNSLVHSEQTPDTKPAIDTSSDRVRFFVDREPSDFLVGLSLVASRYAEGNGKGYQFCLKPPELVGNMVLLNCTMRERADDMESEEAWRSDDSHGVARFHLMKVGAPRYAVDVELLDTVFQYRLQAILADCAEMWPESKEAIHAHLIENQPSPKTSAALDDWLMRLRSNRGVPAWPLDFTDNTSAAISEGNGTTVAAPVITKGGRPKGSNSYFLDRDDFLSEVGKAVAKVQEAARRPTVQRVVERLAMTSRCAGLDDTSHLRKLWKSYGFLDWQAVLTALK